MYNDGPDTFFDGWYSISIYPNATASVFDHCLLRFAGQDNRAAITCLGSSPTITNCHFYKCETGIDLQGGDTPPIIENNVFEESLRAPIMQAWNLAPDLTTNTFTNNNINGIGITQSYWPYPIPTGNYILPAVSLMGMGEIVYVIYESLTIPDSTAPHHRTRRSDEVYQRAKH